MFLYISRERQRELEKQADKEGDLRTERQRQLLADNEGYESDDGDAWEWKPYFKRQELH